MSVLMERVRSTQSPDGLIWPRRSSVRDVQDLRASWSGARFLAATPVTGELVRYAFKQLRVESTRVTEHICIRTAQLIAEQPAEAVALDIVTSGVVVRQHRTGEYRQEAGQASLTLLDQPFTYQRLSHGSAFRVLVPVHLVRAHFGARPIREGLLTASPLVSALTACLVAAMEPAQGPDEYRSLGNVMYEIALALLSKPLVDSDPAPYSTSDWLRSAIERHIESHIAHQNLNTASIAEALGVDVRAVTKAFNTDTRTITSFIRDRRVQVVTDALRAAPHPDHATDLVIQSGFGCIDNLKRAFLKTHGMTPRAFADLHH